MSKVKSISLQNLLIDLQNPRYDPRTNQREAIVTIVNEQGSKLVALAEDIVNEGGLNPSELPMVMSSGDESTFIVMEGNRRLTALKLLLSPSLVSSLSFSDSTVKRFKGLHEKVKEILPTEVICTVFESREEARHWIDLRHTGENGGVGIVPWDGIQTQRFRGSSPSLQAVEYVRNSEFLDEDTRSKLPKIAITNVERILNTTEAREILGVDIKNNELIFKAPEEVVIPRLATIVIDIANVIAYVNSCAVLLRVFVELSVDDYGQIHKIPLEKTIPSRINFKGEAVPEQKVEFSLREKLNAVAEYLETNGLCSKDELRGVRTIITNKEHVLSVNSLNAYIHNKDFHPSDTDLKATWDNLQIFMQRIWSF